MPRDSCAHSLQVASRRACQPMSSSLQVASRRACQPMSSGPCSQVAKGVRTGQQDRAARPAHSLPQSASGYVLLWLDPKQGQARMLTAEALCQRLLTRAALSKWELTEAALCRGALTEGAPCNWVLINARLCWRWLTEAPLCKGVVSEAALCRPDGCGAFGLVFGSDSSEAPESREPWAQRGPALLAQHTETGSPSKSISSSLKKHCAGPTASGGPGSCWAARALQPPLTCWRCCAGLQTATGAARPSGRFCCGRGHPLQLQPLRQRPSGSRSCTTAVSCSVNWRASRWSMYSVTHDRTDNESVLSSPSAT